MAKPTEFPEQNMVFTKPENMTDDECVSLPAYKDENQVISCWQLNEQELKAVTETGRVYLSVLAGGNQPPVAVMGESPFIYEGAENEN